MIEAANGVSSNHGRRLSTKTDIVDTLVLKSGVCSIEFLVVVARHGVLGIQPQSLDDLFGIAIAAHEPVRQT